MVIAFLSGDLLALLFCDSLALLLRFVFSFLSWNLVTLFLRFISGHLLILSVAFFLVDSVTDLVAWLIGTLLVWNLLAVFLGNIIADLLSGVVEVGNRLGGTVFLRDLLTVLLRNLLAHTSGLIPALFTGLIPALLLSIHIAAFLLSNRLALPFSDSVAGLFIPGFTFLFIPCVALLLLLVFLNWFLFNVTFLLVSSTAFFIVLRMAHFFKLIVTALLRHITAFLNRNRVDLRNLDGMTLLFIVGRNKRFLNSVTLLSWFIPALLIPDSVAAGSTTKCRSNHTGQNNLKHF